MECRNMEFVFKKIPGKTTAAGEPLYWQVGGKRLELLDSRTREFGLRLSEGARNGFTKQQIDALKRQGHHVAVDERD